MSQLFRPHDYQHEMIDFIQGVPRGALWASMGSGKSVSTLTALDQIALVEDDIWPALILAPKRVARSTWPTEITKWDHLKHLGAAVVLGDAAERKWALRQHADIFTMNYDNLPWALSQLDGKWPFKTVVADESTRLRGYRLRQGSKRARALASVAHTEVKRFLELTGTPSPKGLSDLWGQIHFLDKGARLGRTYSEFEARWFTKGWDGYSIQPMPHAQREIQHRLRDICLTVSGLPVDKPLVNPIYVDLPAAARTLYKSMEKDFFAEIEGHGVEAFNAAVKSGKLQQISNGAAYFEEGSSAFKTIHDEKLDALASVVEEAAGAPVLVAYTFKSDLARILKAFPWAKHLDDNPKTEADWNAGKIEMLVAHPASCGHGLNLQHGGNILAFFGIDWSLENHEQIIERIGPQRQKQSGYDRPVHVHMILARNTIDDVILERLSSRRSVQEVLREAMRARKRAA